MSTRSRVQLCTSLTILLALLSVGAFAQVPLRDDNSGPYNLTILEGGEGLTRKLEPGTASLDANGAWSMTGWINPRRIEPGPAALLVVGKTPTDSRALFLADGKPGLYADNQVLVSDSVVQAAGDDPNVGFAAIGEIELKGVPRPVLLHEALRGD